MDQSIQVSILVPFFMVEKYVGRCVESLFTQTYANIEYIFVNDYFPYRPDLLVGSTDPYFPNTPAMGLYYKIANVSYGSENNNIVDFVNYNNSESTNFNSYIGPILEIRKVGNIATTSTEE